MLRIRNLKQITRKCGFILFPLFSRTDHMLFFHDFMNLHMNCSTCFYKLFLFLLCVLMQFIVCSKTFVFCRRFSVQTLEMPVNSSVKIIFCSILSEKLNV